MIGDQITLTDELVNDPYPDDHPWSVRYEKNKWNGSVTLTQGGLGSRPIYVCWQQNGAVIGSRYDEVAEKALSLTPSTRGRLELLLFGHTSGVNTLFNEIDRLPPGNRHKITMNGITSEWTDRIVDNGPATLHRTVDVFIAVSRQRVNQNPAGWLPLTGGIDSRTIASVLADVSGIRTYTRGDKTHPEVQQASKIAAHLNLNHYPVPFEERYIAENVNDILKHTGGMVSFDHGHAIHPLKILKRLSPGVAVPGLNGEYGRAFWPVQDGNPAGMTLEEAAENLFSKEIVTRSGRYEELFERDAVAMIENCFEKYVRRYCEAAECACYQHPAAWNDEFYLRDRVRSFSAFGGVIWSSFFMLQTPFLENEYIQSVRSLPPKLRSGPYIHSKVIEKLHPKLLRIPLYPSGKPLKNRWYDFAANGLRRQMTGSKRRKGAQDYPNWLRDEAAFLEPFIQKAHDSFCGFIRKDMVKRLWTEHQSGADHHQILCRLLTSAMMDDLYNK
jgi:hypothetical protein